MLFLINLSVSSFIGSLMEHRQWLDISFKKFLLEAMMDLRFIFLGISLISKNLSWNMTSTSFSNIFFTWPSQLFSRIISYGDSCFRLHLHCVKGVHIQSFFWSWSLTSFVGNLSKHEVAAQLEHKRELTYCSESASEKRWLLW